MLVSKTQLSQYNIADDLFFKTRSGDNYLTSRDQFFITNPTRLLSGLYCAIGSDETGWELERYNGQNWAIVLPNPNYSLIITNNGLQALTSVTKGGMQLKFSGIKMIDSVIKDPKMPVTNWTDTEFLQAGNIVFTVGTNGSPHNSTSDLKQILTWRFSTSSGGLQYIVTLPPEGLGAVSDNNDEEYRIGAIGLYVKDPENNTEDVLFGVASLPNTIYKYASTVDKIGNSIKLYFNTILNNLGVVSNLEMISSGEQNIPEVPNESLLLYPHDNKMRPYNCYLIDNLYGTNLPALAVPRTDESQSVSIPDWSFFMPTDNILFVDPDLFDASVKNYMFTYWNAAHNKYELAEGIIGGGKNDKVPVGIRIGNSIVFSGEIVNTSASYKYEVSVVTSGKNYELGDQLLLCTDNGLTLKVVVTELTGTGGISNFTLIKPTCGNINVDNIVLDPIYDPLYPQPHYGTGSRFNINSIIQPYSKFPFEEAWLNKPLYCDSGKNAGIPTLTVTDSFLGWCTGLNSMRLALDLRNEASTTLYGTTRYATDSEVKERLTNIAQSTKTSVTPSALGKNFLQITKSTNSEQAGSHINNPILVNSFVKYNEVLIGKGINSPYNTQPNITDPNISFYGVAYRALWGDLAEFYEADNTYEPGTLITFGEGDKEISIATTECNGVISTKPGYQLGEKKNDFYLPVALTGRVPVRMDNNCMPKFGDKIYLSKIKPGCASTVENGTCIGKIISKNISNTSLVECVIRIDF